MRQKYETLLVNERDLHKEKQEIETKNAKIQGVLRDFRDRVTKIFDGFLEIMQIKKGIALVNT